MVESEFCSWKETFHSKILKVFQNKPSCWIWPDNWLSQTVLQRFHRTVHCKCGTRFSWPITIIRTAFWTFPESLAVCQTHQITLDLPQATILVHKWLKGCNNHNTPVCTSWTSDSESHPWNPGRTTQCPGAAFWIPSRSGWGFLLKQTGKIWPN